MGVASDHLHAPIPAYEFMKTFKPASLALVALLALGACGGDSGSDTASDDTPTTAVGEETATTAAPEDTEPGSTGQSAQGDSISIANFAFDPDDLEAAPGAEITVTNNDDAVHTLTAVDKSVDTGNIEKGKSATITTPQSGELAYFCSIHEYMKGVIRVTG